MRWRNCRRRASFWRKCAPRTLSRELVLPRFNNEGMAMWREILFANLHHNAASAADFLCLPTNRVVEVGAQVEI